MYCTVPGCTALYLQVLFCTWCTASLLGVLYCTRVYCAVPVLCTVPGCTFLYLDVLFYIRVYCTVPDCTVLVVLLVNYSSPRGLEDECIQIWSFQSIQPKHEKGTDYLPQTLHTHLIAWLSSIKLLKCRITIPQFSVSHCIPDWGPDVRSQFHWYT